MSALGFHKITNTEFHDDPILPNGESHAFMCIITAYVEKPLHVVEYKRFLGFGATQSESLQEATNSLQRAVVKKE